MKVSYPRKIPDILSSIDQVQQFDCTVVKPSTDLSSVPFLEELSKAFASKPSYGHLGNQASANVTFSVT